MMSLLAFGAGFRRTSSPRTGFCLRLAAPSSSPGSGLRHAFRPKLVDGAAGLLEGRRYDRTAKILPRCRSRLSNLIRYSLAQFSSSLASPSSSELWPCPVPPPLARPRTCLVGRRGARWKARSVSRLVRRQFIAACNWLAVNHTELPPAALPPLSNQQRRMIERLEVQASSWIR